MPASLEKQLALSRALGLHGAPELKRSVSATPHQTRVALDEHCAVLVLASEALFRAFEPEHVGALIHEVRVEYNACDQTSGTQPSLLSLLFYFVLFCFNFVLF